MVLSLSLKPHRRPFSQYVLVSIIVMILAVALAVTVFDYLQARDNLEENAVALKNQTEQNLIQSTLMADAGFRLFDDSLNTQMKQGFSLFLQEYERSGRDPARMNLESVKERIGKNMDLYIINESGVIEYTTYAPELGLDFKSIPYFYDYLTEIRQSAGFFPDRVVRELGSNQLRKYAYMPTPDHQYILELGLISSEFQSHSYFSPDPVYVQQMVSLNPYIKDVRVFDVEMHLVSGDRSLPDVQTQAVLEQVIQERRGLEIKDPSINKDISYLFIDLKNEQYGSDLSRVVELTYNPALIQQDLNDLLLFHFLVAIGAILIGGGLAVLISRRLTWPIRSIASDVEIVSRGDLDHKVAPTISREFEVIEKSINEMVERLKETLENERKSEERYRAVVEGQTEFIARFLPDGTHIFVNEAYCRYFGKECREIVGKRFIPHIPDEEKSRVKDHFASLTPSHPEATIEHRIIMPGGEIRSQQWSDRAIFNTTGEIVEFQSVGRDITDRIQVEENLRESEKKYKDLVALLPQLVFEIAADGTLTFANKNGLEQYGYSLEDLKAGINAFDMVISDDKDRLKEAVQKILSGRTTAGSEYRIRKKDGTYVTTLAYSSPIVQQGGQITGIRGILADITRLKQAEERLRTLNEGLERRVAERTAELEAANRELESFTYTVSHDLRAPLRALDGFSSILLRESSQKLTEHEIHYLQLVRKNAQQMAQLINDLLDFSRIGRKALEKEWIEPKGVVYKIMDELSGERAGRNIGITIGALPQIFADSAMFHQVFSNLLSNALKFTRKVDPAQIEIGSYPQGQDTVYYVRDNGVGMDIRHASKIFEVFQRFHKTQDYEGTGVGLAIVKRIIDRHEGRIWVESEVGKGFTFYFTLPGAK
jgi:PAS domain S-box-containing protein